MQSRPGRGTKQQSPIPAGTIVCLNGPSSCGKHAIVAALQRRSPKPWANVSIHDWYAETATLPAVPPPFLMVNGRVGAIQKGSTNRTSFAQRYQQAVMLAHQGHNVMIDDSLFEPWMIPTAARILAPRDAYLIGVHCDLEQLEAREADRADRPPGLASYLRNRVHHHAVYDLSLNTTRRAAMDCAAVILARLKRGHPPVAFRYLAQRYPAPLDVCP